MADHAIVHVEIPADNPSAASKFYADLFGWGVQYDEGLNYHMFQAASGPAGGIVQVGEDPPYKAGELVVYVSADDIDATLAKAESLGATTIMPKMEIPGVGWFAFFADPTGNRIGLYTVAGQ
jgi:uncharacterized protein